MKKITTLLFLSAIAILSIGCSGEDSAENAAEVKKMASQPMESNNPDVPTIDAKNDEFGPSTGGGKKLGGM